MLSMTAALERIKGRITADVPDELILRLSQEVGHRWRDRDLGPVVTTHVIPPFSPFSLYIGCHHSTLRPGPPTSSANGVSYRPGAPGVMARPGVR